MVVIVVVEVVVMGSVRNKGVKGETRSEDKGGKGKV